MHCLIISDLGELLNLLADVGVTLLEVFYELVRALLSHNAFNQHLPPSLLRSITTLEWSGEKHDADSGKQDMFIGAAFLGGSDDCLGRLTAARRI